MSHEDPDGQAAEGVPNVVGSIEFVAPDTEAGTSLRYQVPMSKNVHPERPVRRYSQTRTKRCRFVARQRRVSRPIRRSSRYARLVEPRGPYPSLVIGKVFAETVRLRFHDRAPDTRAPRTAIGIVRLPDLLHVRCLAASLGGMQCHLIRLLQVVALQDVNLSSEWPVVASSPERRPDRTPVRNMCRIEEKDRANVVGILS